VFVPAVHAASLSGRTAASSEASWKPGTPSLGCCLWPTTEAAARKQKAAGAGAAFGSDQVTSAVGRRAVVLDNGDDMYLVSAAPAAPVRSASALAHARVGGRRRNSHRMALHLDGARAAR